MATVTNHHPRLADVHPPPLKQDAALKLQSFNPWWLGNTYMHQRIWSSSFQEMHPRCQTITWTSVDNCQLDPYVNYILIKSHEFSIMRMYLNISSAAYRSFCTSLNVLKSLSICLMDTNKLMLPTAQLSWQREFPRLPTKRDQCVLKRVIQNRIFDVIWYISRSTLTPLNLGNYRQLFYYPNIQPPATKYPNNAYLFFWQLS